MVEQYLQLVAAAALGGLASFAWSQVSVRQALTRELHASDVRSGERLARVETRLEAMEASLERLERWRS